MPSTRRGHTIIHLIKTDSVGMVHWEKVPVQTGKSSHQLEIEEGDTNLLFPLFKISPNPFTGKTVIHYQLPFTGKVRITVSDITGRCVAIILNEEKIAGRPQVIWQPKGLTSGVYFVTVAAPNSHLTERIVLLH